VRAHPELGRKSRVLISDPGRKAQQIRCCQINKPVMLPYKKSEGRDIPFFKIQIRQGKEMNHARIDPEQIFSFRHGGRQ
jgi:hypothetical protein